MNNQPSSSNQRGLHALELRQQGNTLDEIGNYLHVSRERVRQILLKTEAEIEGFKKFEKLKVRCSTLALQREIPAEILEMSIDHLNLSVRTSNCLKTTNIKTIGNLICQQSTDLLKIPHMGKKSVNEIIQAIEEVGLALC